MEAEYLKSNIFWLILLGVIVVISALAALLPGQTSSSYAYIYESGELTDTVNIAAITAPFTKTIESGGNVNVIAIEHGRIRMLSANCPDGTCVRQGWISGGVFPIVCLPNRVVITLEGSDNEFGVDAVVKWTKCPLAKVYKRV